MNFGKMQRGKKKRDGERAHNFGVKKIFVHLYCQRVRLAAQDVACFSARKSRVRIPHTLQQYLVLSVIAIPFASVAQLDRASDFDSDGWGFESLPAHEKF